MIYQQPAVNQRSRGKGKGKAKGNRSRKRDRTREATECDFSRVSNGVVTLSEEKVAKMVKRQPIEKLYKVEEEPFATGLFATVKRVRHRQTGEVFAAKFASRLRYGSDCTAELLHEAALLSFVSSSPKIVRLQDVFETPTDVVLVMEYASGGDLQSIIDDDMVPFERDVVKFVKQMLEGLAYIHDKKIAHLDIKPQNLVMMGPFPDCDVKLCDFEISRVILDGAEVREILGTPDYVAPEVLQFEPITVAADMWSVGVVTYVLLTGFSPFAGDTDQETFWNICQNTLDFPEELFEDVSEEARDFIRRLIVREPRSRLSAKQSLKHPWIVSCGKNVAVARQVSAPSGDNTVPALRRQSIKHMHHSTMSLRNLSKSREVLCERLAGTELRKNVSKSRERLWELKMSLSRSRDMLLSHRHNHGGEDMYWSFKSLSRSQEAIPAAIRSSTSNTSINGAWRLSHLSSPMVPEGSLACLLLGPSRCTPLPEEPECELVVDLQDKKADGLPKPPLHLRKLPFLWSKSQSEPTLLNRGSSTQDTEKKEDDSVQQPTETPATPAVPAQESAPEVEDMDISESDENDTGIPTDVSGENKSEAPKRPSVAQLILNFNKQCETTTITNTNAGNTTNPRRHSVAVAPERSFCFSPFSGDSRRSPSPLRKFSRALENVADEEHQKAEEEGNKSSVNSSDVENNNSETTEDDIAKSPAIPCITIQTAPLEEATVAEVEEEEEYEEHPPPLFLRSESLSSEEEASGNSSSEDTCSSEATRSPSPTGHRQRSGSAHVDLSFFAQPWNRLCVGAVSRAMEKFGAKSVEGLSNTNSTASNSKLMPPDSSSKLRRQSSPIIKSFV